MQDNTLTVAICTYNRSWILPEALDALLGQSTGTDKFEFILVDNASTDDTRLIADSYSSKFHNFKYVLEESQGLSYARNRALKEASSDWVLFLDDDGLAAKDLVEKALNYLKNNPRACFGGSIKAWRRDPLPDWFLNEYEELNFKTDKQSFILDDSSYVFGGNFAVKRDLALDLGAFDVELGMKGDSIVFGEETDFQNRLRAKGHSIAFIPNMILYHYARPEKYTIFAQLRIQYKYGESDQVLSGNASIKSLGMILARLILSPLKGICISIKRLAAKEFRWQNATIEICGRFCHWYGHLYTWVRMRKNK